MTINHSRGHVFSYVGYRKYRQPKLMSAVKVVLSEQLQISIWSQFLICYNYFNHKY